MKEQYLYPATTGHTIISPVLLDYAMNTKLEVEICKIKPADFSHVNIITDPILARTAKTLLEEKKWRSADEAMDNPFNLQSTWEGDICIIKDGVLYIREGKKYVSIETLIAKSDKDTLAVALRFIANQAALCQATIANLLCKGGSEAK